LYNDRKERGRKMIVTVTLNPAIDKTAYVPQVIAGGLNRLENIRQDAGGKGINVSRMLHQLGQASIATGFLGGQSGSFIADALKEEGIEADFVWIKEQTRTNLKVMSASGSLSEFNEPGPSVNKEQLDQLEEILKKHAFDHSCVILSGNTGPNVSKEIYKKWIELVHIQGGKVILDADGELFAQGVKAHPDILKPNWHELAGYFGLDEEVDLETMLLHAKTLLNEKTRLLVLSRGEKGSLFLTKEHIYEADAIDLVCLSSVGAGDSMVAALAYALEQNLDIEETIRLAVACSASACMSEGTSFGSKKQIEDLKSKVTFRKLK
jgi:1-phosphofructokinase